MTLWGGACGSVLLSAGHFPDGVAVDVGDCGLDASLMAEGDEAAGVLGVGEEEHLAHGGFGE